MWGLPGLCGFDGLVGLSFATAVTVTGGAVVRRDGDAEVDVGLGCVTTSRAVRLRAS